LGWLLPSHFLIGAESLGNGRRVKGREAIADDAEGALDAAAVTGTLERRGRRLLHVVADRARWKAALTEARRKAEEPGGNLSATGEAA
jgi:hypothetical protein